MSNPHDPWAPPGRNLPPRDNPAQDNRAPDNQGYPPLDEETTRVQASGPATAYPLEEPSTAQFQSDPAQQHPALGPDHPYGAPATGMSGTQPTSTLPQYQTPQYQNPQYQNPQFQTAQYEAPGYPPSQPQYETMSYPAMPGYPQFGAGVPDQPTPGGGEPPEHGPDHRDRRILFAALGAVVVALIIGAIIFVSVLDSDPDTKSAATSASTTSQPATTRTTPEIQLPPLPSISLPSLPPLPTLIDRVGVAAGQITAIDGTTITISPTLGTVTTLHTSAATTVIGPGASVAELKVGQVISAQGTPDGPHSMTANVILGISLGN